MSNLKISLPSVDGSLYDYLDEDDTCKDIIHNLYTNDFAAPPVRMDIQVATTSGKIVRIAIPYDSNGDVRVFIDNAEI